MVLTETTLFIGVSNFETTGIKAGATTTVYDSALAPIWSSPALPLRQNLFCLLSDQSLLYRRVRTESRISVASMERAGRFSAAFIEAFTF